MGLMQDVEKSGENRFAKQLHALDCKAKGWFGPLILELERIRKAIDTGNQDHRMIGDGRLNLTAARLPLSVRSQFVNHVDITLDADAVGYVCVGGSMVIADAGSETGNRLTPGTTTTLYNVDLADVYVATTTPAGNQELEICYTYPNAR